MLKHETKYVRSIVPNGISFCALPICTSIATQAYECEVPARALDIFARFDAPTVSAQFTLCDRHDYYRPAYFKHAIDLSQTDINILPMETLPDHVSTSQTVPERKQSPVSDDACDAFSDETITRPCDRMCEHYSCENDRNINSHFCMLHRGDCPPNDRYPSDVEAYVKARERLEQNPMTDSRVAFAEPTTIQEVQSDIARTRSSRAIRSKARSRFTNNAPNKNPDLDF